MKQLQRWFLRRGAKTTGKKTQLDTSRLWYSIKYQTRGVPEVICAERHTTIACLVIYSRWLLDLFPQTIPKMCARFVWVPGYHSFPHNANCFAHKV